MDRAWREANRKKLRAQQRKHQAKKRARAKERASGPIIAHTSSDYATFIAWLRTPLASILMILLLIALFYHTALGLRVVIEDYVHSGAKFAALAAVRLGCSALAAAGIVAALRIAFGG